MQDRDSVRAAKGPGNARRLITFVVFGLVPIALLMAPKAEAAAYSATASVVPAGHYLDDSSGTLFRFTIDNTGTTAGIGAVEIARPSNAWKVTSCPVAPFGWSAQRSDTMCRYRSKTTTADDIKPGKSSQLFALRATTLPGTEDRTGAWRVTVSRTHDFSNKSALTPAPAPTPGGLDVTAHSFQVLAAGVAAAPVVPGAACPTLSSEAITGTTQDIVVCGRNRTTTTLSPSAANSSLAGTWIGTANSFASGPIAPTAGSVVLGTWDNAVLTNVFGDDKTVIATVGSAANRTSPATTFTGYNATNRTPVPVAGSGSTLEDTVSSAIALSASDDDGDPITFAIGTPPAHGTLSAITAGSCSGATPNVCGATVTYTPNADSNGADSFTYTASDPYSTSAPATVDVTVTPVNDAPSFTKGADQTVNEDSGEQTVNGWATAISTGPANESAQAISGFTATNDNNGLFSVQPAVSPTGVLTYTAAPNTSGSTTVTVGVADNGGTANGGDDTSNTQTFTITVNAVNDEPTFTKGTNVTVLEDSGSFSAAGWATNVSPGAADETGQALTFNAINDNNALFSVQPAVDAATGDLTFTPAANRFGSTTVTVTLSDNGGTANGGDDSSQQTFTITVTGVNDEPSFTKGADQTVNEDSGAQTVNGWATAVSAGPQETQTLTFTVTPDDATLFSVAPAVNPTTGALTYTPAANANGATNVTVALSDNGGTDNGGDDTSPSQSFSITLGPLNDAPSFTKGADQTVNEDAEPQSVSNWASAISKGPADESAQSLSFTTSNDNNGLFSVQPGVTPTGTLVYTPAANAFGTATVTISLSDTGGTANGGDDTSDSQTFNITINPVNDNPSFTPGGNQVVNEDSGAQTVNDWATNVSPGPFESDTVTFSITANDNSGLFSTQPALSNDGVLTYTPAANTSGVANLTATANDGQGGTSNENFTITVSSVNDNPSFTGGADQTVNEDSGAQTVNDWATSISPGANESDTVTFSITANDNTGLFSAGPAVSDTGTLTYTPAPNKNGVANLTVTANDGAGGTADDSLVITVGAVNDEPSFTKGSALVVPTDGQPKTYPGWATNISPGPADEAAQVLTFQLFEEDGTFLVGDATLDPATGDLTLTPANKHGTELIHVLLKDDGGTANGGDDTHQTSFTIDFVPPNATPVAQATSASGNEDPGTGYTVTLTGTDADDDDLTFNVGTASQGLVTVPGAIDCTTVANTCTTTVTYTPNANANGEDSFTYTVHDGTVESTEATATITVNAVNDAPSFTKGADQTVNEDAEPQSVSNWASAISKGPADESAQSLSFTTSNDNNSLFSVQPGVTPTGTLVYTPAANAFGTATVTISLSDTGGTANGGDDTSDSQTFVITVNSVNDVPVAGDDSQTTNEDTFVNLAVKANDTDVDNDALTIHAFDATSADGAPVTDNGDGTLKYNPAGLYDHLNVDEANETDTFSYTIKDGNGGFDTATVTITITPVNDPPVAQPESQTVIGNTLHAVSTTGTGPHTTGAGQLDDGVVDPDDDTFTVTAGSVTSTDSGTATINSDGSYTFLPGQGDRTGDTFTFTVNDAHGGSDTETATITISDMVWYVDNSLGAAGDGRSSAPFNTIAPLDTAGTADAKDASGDHIFVYQGTAAYTGGLLLEGTQKLWGQPKGLTVASTPLVAAGGTNPVLNDGLTLANNTDVQAVNLGAATMALSGSSVGTSTVGTTHPITINNGSGGGISLVTGAPTVNVSKLTSSGGTHGINLQAITGSVTVSDATSSIASPATAGVSVSGGTATVTYPGSVSASGAARSIAASNNTGGTISLTGAVNDTGTGISLTNNGGTTVNMAGALTLSTTTNPAFTATGGGTVTASNSTSTITTTGGTAVNVANTTIGAADLVFRSINVNTAGGATPPNGIVLNNTGSVGNLTVTGTGTAGTGGTIRGTTGVGVSLTSTRDVVLNHVKVQDTGNHGIQANGVTNLTLTGVEVPGAGDADNERAVDLTNVGGALAISGGSYSDSSDDLVKLANTNTNVTVTVNNAAQFKDLTQANANNAIQLEPNGTSAINATITGNTFSNLKNSSTMLGAATAGSSGTSSLTFTNNSVSGGAQGGAGVFVSGQENTSSTVTITGNTFNGAGGNGVVNHDVNDNSNLVSTIMNNTFTSPKGHGIVGAVDEDADTRMRIENNTITNAGGDGIELTNFGDDSAAGMTSTAHFIVRNNTVNGHSLTSGVQFVGGIGIFHFENDADTTCAAVTGNTVQNTPAGFFDIYLQDNSNVGSFKYEENPNTGATGFVSDSYVQSLNPNTTLANVANSGAVYSNGTTCSNP